ncbi:MAG TPA: hypothetical protein VIT45_18335 [Allosphingosinicella sp.]
MSSIKASKGADIGLPLSGKLAELKWVKTSRKSPPSEKAALAGDVVYNVETAEDIGRAFKRQMARK